ncbi:MAG: hypothetical protein PHW95_04785 [Patescibacteria group bacterium]|nr:hypothetical protein [Patescibacteria group bacterium]
MEIVLDFSGIPTNDPLAFGWWFIKTIGWIYPVFLFCYGLIIVWQNYIRNEYRKTRQYTTLAIDVPKNNEQTPKAVENIFSHLAGAHQPLKFYQNWWFGELKNSFSFEIVSIGGYIQFIIHFVDKYRDLVEAIIYAQYPDAEITEVEDYTKRWHDLKFPNDKYDLQGSEIKLKANEAYPITTYEEFEDTISGELKDPMASTLEAMSRLGPGEELWLQYVITPADNDWNHTSERVVKKLIGAKADNKKNLVDYLFDIPNIFLEAINPAPATSSSSDKKSEPNQLLYLTAGQKDAVAAVEHKANKLGFNTRIRYIYIAEKSVFNKQRAGIGIYGSLKQFNDLGLNSFRPDTHSYTGGIVWFKDRRLITRKNRILRRFMARGHFLNPGEYGFVLSTEEMATIWHFPVMQVKAPMVKKTEAKKGEPPMSLPVAMPGEGNLKPKSLTMKSEPPSDLPVS